MKSTLCYRNTDLNHKMTHLKVNLIYGILQSIWIFIIIILIIIIVYGEITRTVIQWLICRILKALSTSLVYVGFLLTKRSMYRTANVCPTQKHCKRCEAGLLLLTKTETVENVFVNWNKNNNVWWKDYIKQKLEILATNWKGKTQKLLTGNILKLKLKQIHKPKYNSSHFGWSQMHTCNIRMEKC